MDDYTVLIYFENNTESGFYVLDLPNRTVAKNGFYVMASASPFNAQANVPLTPDFNWSNPSVLNASSGDSYLKKYVFNGIGYTPTDVIAGELNDIIQRRRGSEGQFHTLIFDGEDLVNFFVGGYSTLPSYVNTWATLTVPHFRSGQTAMPDKVFDFSTLATNDVESVISNPGSNNGYRRTRDGQCGTWVKSSSGSEHTPGYTNGATSNAGTLVVSATLSQAGLGSNTLNVSYNVLSSSDPTVWPVTVRIVNDYGADMPSADVNESKLPEGPNTSYNSYYEEEAVSTGNANPNYNYPLTPFSAGGGGARNYLTSPIVTSGAYAPTYTGSTKQPRSFHVFFQAASGCFDQVWYIEIAAIPTLPVTFKSFSAKRNKQNVVLSWQTASEQNNAGFSIERNINGNWSEIAYVPSQASGGNSNVDLFYTYNDLNNHKGISQYRIRQYDLDAKSSYSVVRSVQGEGSGPKMVIYPNPSFDGRVQIVFEDASSSRHIVISDMSGRIVRQISNIQNSSITLDGLTNGLYTARVINQATGESTLQKFVIQQK